MPYFYLSLFPSRNYFGLVVIDNDFADRSGVTILDFLHEFSIIGEKESDRTIAPATYYKFSILIQTYGIA